MVAALELYFDPPAERRFRRLWAALDEAGVPNLGSHTHRRHRPHLSLVAADELDPVKVPAALRGVVIPPLVLTYQFVGQFPGGVLWLGPAPTAELLALHAEVTARLETAGLPFSELYRAGTWIPHTTLSMTARGEAITKGVRLCVDVVPMTATLSGAAVVDHNRNIDTPL